MDLRESNLLELCGPKVGSASRLRRDTFRPPHALEIRHRQEPLVVGQKDATKSGPGRAKPRTSPSQAGPGAPGPHGRRRAQRAAGRRAVTFPPLRRGVLGLPRRVGPVPTASKWIQGRERRRFVPVQHGPRAQGEPLPRVRTARPRVAQGRSSSVLWAGAGTAFAPEPVHPPGPVCHQAARSYSALGPERRPQARRERGPSRYTLTVPGSSRGGGRCREIA